MKKLMIALFAVVVLSGCALQPWTQADHELYAKRYCGGMQNYDQRWTECKGMRGSMVGKTAAPVQVYIVRPGDEDAVRDSSPGGVIFQRD